MNRYSEINHLWKNMLQILVEHLQIWKQSRAVHADNAGRHPALDIWA